MKTNSRFAHILILSILTFSACRTRETVQLSNTSETRNGAQSRGMPWLEGIHLGMARKEVLVLKEKKQIYFVQGEHGEGMAAIQTSSSDLSFCDVIRLKSGIELNLVYNQRDNLEIIETYDSRAKSVNGATPGITLRELRRLVPKREPRRILGYGALFLVEDDVWLASNYVERSQPLDDELIFVKLQIRSDLTHCSN